MNISILIPSRNGQEFLEWSYNSIRKNQGNHDVEILVLDDISDKDNTWEWCLKTMQSDPEFKAFRNETGKRYGISTGYSFLSKFATNPVIAHWHNDMFMTAGTLDEVEKYLSDNEKNVVCLTRIEPPIYGKGFEKITWDDAPIELEDWNEQKFLDFLPVAHLRWNNKITGGHFVPFFMFRESYEMLGGNDIVNFPLQAREDSDFAFRLVLSDHNTIQIPIFVFHFASRGNRRSKHGQGSWVDNPEWVEINRNSERNFIRKWKTLKLHDEYLKPYKPSVHKIEFVVDNSNIGLLDLLEPWCDAINIDLPEHLILNYIKSEQPNTSFELSYKINSQIIDVNPPQIRVFINGKTFTKEDFDNIMIMQDIISSEGEIGNFEIGNLKIDIKKIEPCEQNLIVCKN